MKMRLSTRPSGRGVEKGKVGLILETTNDGEWNCFSPEDVLEWLEESHIIVEEMINANSERS